MGEKLGGKGKVAILGRQEKARVSTDERRRKGFRDTIRKKFPESRSSRSSFYARPTRRNRCMPPKSLLTSHSDLTGLFASNESSNRGRGGAPYKSATSAGKSTLVGLSTTGPGPGSERSRRRDSISLVPAKTRSRWASRA